MRNDDDDDNNDDDDVVVVGGAWRAVRLKTNITNNKGTPKRNSGLRKKKLTEGQCWPLVCVFFIILLINNYLAQTKLVQ